MMCGEKSIKFEQFHLNSRRKLSRRLFFLIERRGVPNPSLVDGSDGKKILQMRLQMKPGTTSDQMKISLNGYDLRIEVDNKVSSDSGRVMSKFSPSLFPGV